MDRERAKQILLAYRPGTEDESEPDVAQALDLAKRDADLHEWLQEQTAFQQAVRAQLRSISIPPELKDSILARRKIVTPIWRRPELLLAAACIAIAFVLTAFWVRGRSEDETFAGFQKRMVGFALRLYRMDIETNDLVQVGQFLAAKGAPTNFALTPGLRQTPVKGGAYLTWQDHPVSMVCFTLPKAQTLYMFVMNQSAIQKGRLPGPTPILQFANGIMIASWSQNGRVYLIAADPNAADLKKLTGSKSASQPNRLQARLAWFTQPTTGLGCLGACSTVPLTRASACSFPGKWPRPESDRSACRNPGRLGLLIRRAFHGWSASWDCH
jgi:uncharacterized membrane protein YbaN (DUF454 family)